MMLYWVIRKIHMRKGFTFIELVIAMAIFLVVIVIAFSTLSSYFAVRSANEQEMILQQNFRAALDKITDDFRQASTNAGEIILEPDPNAMGVQLSFLTYDSYLSKYVDVYYYLKPSGEDTSTLFREEYNQGSTPETGSPIEGTSQPVTENMHQLVKAYFVRVGGKVIMIVVGRLKYFGKERTISFTSLVFSRNSAYEVPQLQSP